jgi:hypothetical protein
LLRVPYVLAAGWCHQCLDPMATSTQSLPPPAQSVPSSAQRSSLSPRGQEPQDSHPSRAIVVIAKSTPLLPSIKDRHLRPTATSNPFLRLSLPSPPAAPDAAALSVFPTALHPRCSVRACEAKLKDHRRRFFFVTVGRLERPPANSTAANLDTRAVFFRRLSRVQKEELGSVELLQIPTRQTRERISTHRQYAPGWSAAGGASAWSTVRKARRRFVLFVESL